MTWRSSIESGRLIIGDGPKNWNGTPDKLELVTPEATPATRPSEEEYNTHGRHHHARTRGTESGSRRTQRTGVPTEPPAPFKVFHLLLIAAPLLPINTLLLFHHHSAHSREIRNDYQKKQKRKNNFKTPLLGAETYPRILSSSRRRIKSSLKCIRRCLSSMPFRCRIEGFTSTTNSGFTFFLY